MFQFMAKENGKGYARGFAEKECGIGAGYDPKVSACLDVGTGNKHIGSKMQAREERMS